MSIRDLLRNALRMRPDRIVVGEVRGPEALDMLQAMNTGHDGSLSTVHCNSPRDAVSRIETMVLMAGFDLPVRAIREQVASALHLIVHTERLHDGSRKVVRITEVQRMEGDQVTLRTYSSSTSTGRLRTAASRSARVDRPASDVQGRLPPPGHRAAGRPLRDSMRRTALTIAILVLGLAGPRHRRRRRPARRSCRSRRPRRFRSVSSRSSCPRRTSTPTTSRSPRTACRSSHISRRSRRTVSLSASRSSSTRATACAAGRSPLRSLLCRR